ncbi:unnamed protein product [Haemonchus placei]|uniref:Uncharacterized protein n=1 Tax=Haemonchus placei TaxID=6290 RepID=A0A0N4X5T2_HAEPC|nr:unnamed protein product [Haemonchus placei]
MIRSFAGQRQSGVAQKRGKTQDMGLLFPVWCVHLYVLSIRLHTRACAW